MSKQTLPEGSEEEAALKAEFVDFCIARISNAATGRIARRRQVDHRIAIEEA